MVAKETKMVRVSKKAADKIELLKNITKQSGIKVVDDILPSEKIINLMVARNNLVGNKGGRFLALDIGTACVKLMTNQMIGDFQHSVKEHYIALKEMAPAVSDVDDFTVELELYDKWLRCRNNEEGYFFFDAGVKSDGLKQFIAVGPGEEKKTAAIKAYIQETAEKLSS